MQDVIYANGIYMAIGLGVTVTSTDGINWANAAPIADNNDVFGLR